MKKLVSFVLVFALIFSLSACGGGGGSSVSEIETAAREGRISEFSIKLGSSPEEVVEYYAQRAENEDNEDLIISDYEGETAVKLTNGVQTFYYEKANKDKGVSVFVVTGETAYGFELGEKITKSDITEKVGGEYTEHTATADDLFFLPGTVEGATVVSYAFDNIRLDFFFFDGILSAISLTNTEYWTD